MHPRVYALLVHYPVTDRRGDVVATSVTTLDIHDIARSARTYGLAGYFVVTPVEAQHWLVRRVTQHWNDEWGSAYNPNRKDALQVIRLASDIGEAATAIREETGEEPVWVGTSAKAYPNSITFANLRERMEQEPGRPLQSQNRHAPPDECDAPAWTAPSAPADRSP